MIHRRSRIQTVLADALGVHRTTMGRDLAELWDDHETCVETPDGDILYTITRARRGGPIVKVYDAQGRRVRGPERRWVVRIAQECHRRCLATPAVSEWPAQARRARGPLCDERRAQAMLRLRR
jgi:hypothetical protein